MFDQKSDQDYPINKKVFEINCKDVKQGVASFGVIYQNIVAWLRARQIKRGKQYYKDALKECSVVFVWTCK